MAGPVSSSSPLFPHFAFLNTHIPRLACKENVWLAWQGAVTCSHLLVQYPDGRNDQSWAELKPASRSLVQAFHVDVGAGSQGT